jgi:thiosulfate/3-mercaptopyruvate sulfurtransferase
MPHALVPTVLIAALVAGCADADDDPVSDGALIVQPDDLEAGRVVAVDVRGVAQWSAGHVVDATVLDAASLRATVDGVDGQVTPVETSVGIFGAAGLTQSDAIVVYGETNDTAAARVVWTLRYHGHMGEVAMLDGGFARWRAEDRDIDLDATPRDATQYAARVVPELRPDAAWVLEHLGDPGVTLIDARSPEEFAAGHIPGAVSVEWTRNLGSDGNFLPAADLRELYGDPPPNQSLVVYCQTGSRAAVDWLVLSQLGYEDVRLYDGSWEEWSALPEYPQER